MLKTLEVQLCLLDVSFDLPAAEEFGALFQHWPESLNCPFTESISKDLLQTQMLPALSANSAMLAPPACSSIVYPSIHHSGAQLSRQT